MRIIFGFYFFIVFIIPIYSFGQANIYEVTNGIVYFHSEAQTELIRATSKSLIGAVDLSKRTFLFKINMASFAGFNNPLQKEHFNENYMESDRFPLATYSGKIIEETDLTKDGDYYIRAKGKLTIHGVAHQQIIKCHIICKKGKIKVQADFIVMLADYNINIPRIVSDKLSEEINISVNAGLESKAST
jgi:polyisoprenoid-binding protein YceI